MDAFQMEKKFKTKRQGIKVHRYSWVMAYKPCTISPSQTVYGFMLYVAYLWQGQA